MSSRHPSQSYRDILEAIDSIEKFTEGMDYEAFQHDPKTVAAVEMKLMQIAEAAVRLRGQALPDQPWHNLRGMGNFLRHQYDTVSLEIVWNTIQYDLAQLKQISLDALNSA